MVNDHTPDEGEVQEMWEEIEKRKERTAEEKKQEMLKEDEEKESDEEKELDEE